MFWILLLYFMQLHPHASASEIFADSHIHYNWDHREETSIEEVVNILKQHNVGLTIVTSTPSELALELREQGGDWIIPFFSPYIHELGKRNWYMDEQVVKKPSKVLKADSILALAKSIL